MRRAKAVDHDPAESLMRELGAQLRQERLKRGEDLDDVAQHLRIKSGYLFALEQGDLSGMPGRAYALGFLRSYADYLGFDGEDLISRIKSTVDNLTDQTRLRVRTPAPESRLPKTPVVVMSLAVIAGIYAGWAYLNRTSRVTVETVAEVPDDLRARSDQALPAVADEGSPAVADEATPAADPSPDVPAPDSAAADLTPTADLESPLPGTTGASATPPSAEPPQASPGPLVPEAGPAAEQPGAVAGVAPPETPAMQPGAGSPPGTPAPTEPQANARPAPARAAAAAAADAEQDALALAEPTPGDARTEADQNAIVEPRVLLRAREQAWIQISSPSGDYAFTRTLEPGEVVTVPNRADLVLWTGNAGGLDIIVDGAPVPALAGAGSGTVRRNVSLDPERLLETARQR
jgi:cytoskeleton protein RodZ